MTFIFTLVVPLNHKSMEQKLDFQAEPIQEEVDQMRIVDSSRKLPSSIDNFNPEQGSSRNERRFLTQETPRSLHSKGSR